jgi:hypothetical protein
MNRGREPLAKRLFGSGLFWRIGDLSLKLHVPHSIEIVEGREIQNPSDPNASMKAPSHPALLG